ncbi:hypothetical protein TNCV_2799631 [Trichonephila clavipes]|nr:hypothetical protein TNCV_2799631 [Trichonephila clavipes]
MMNELVAQGKRLKTKILTVVYERIPLTVLVRVVVYRASTPQVLGSINGLDKVDSAFHPHYIGSINGTKLAWGLNT